MNDELKIEVLREALQQVLDNEAMDYKASQEWGGYLLDPDVKEAVQRALALTASN